MGEPILFVVVAAWAGLLLWAWRAPVSRQVAAVAGLYEVPLTTETTPLLEQAVRWTRRGRVLGAIVVPLIALFVFDIGVNVLTIAIGIAVGSVLAELTRRSPTAGTVRGALLHRRSVTSYVSRALLIACAAVCSVLMVTTALAVSVAGDDDRTIAVGAIGFAVGCSTIAVAQLIARRRLPAPGARAVVDHAIRSASIMSIVGSGSAIVGLAVLDLAGTVLEATDARGLRYLTIACGFIGFVALLGGISLSFRALPRRGFGSSAAAPDNHVEASA